MPDSLDSNLPPALAAVRTRPLFVMRLEVRPIQVIGTPPGDRQRRIGVVFGGSFAGDRLSGVVLDGGNDWQAVRADGTIALDVRLVLRTDDEALIGMTYRGLRHAPPSVAARIEAGEEADPAIYYFRISPYFETASVRYDWLNRIVAIGIGHRDRSGPLYSVFEVQ